MNKKSLLACLLAVMLLLSSCSLIVKDEAVDAATEIVRVGDTVYTKGDVNMMVSNYLAQMQDYYAQYYGYNIDVTSASAISSAQDEVINSLIRTAVVEAKETEMGVGTLSEEKQAEVDDLWNQYTDLIKSIFLADSELEGEELEQMAAAYVYSTFGVTKESMEASEKELALREMVVADVAVTDEEIQTAYDEKVEAAKTSYASSLSAYGTAVNGGTEVFYRPAGYRMVKSILLKFQQEDSDRISDLTSKASAQGTAATTTRNQINAMEAAAEQDIDALCAMVEVTTAADEEAGLTAATTDTLPEDLDADLAQAIRDYAAALALQAGFNDLKAEAIETAFANLDEEADGILAQLDEGADWTALQAEKTQDPGMQSGATAENGYAVCEGFTSFDSAYVAAAMALENVGDHTGKVRSDSYGYFIIRYDSEVEEGPVALDNVKESVQAEVLSSKQDALYSETVDKWVAEANTVINKKALND